MRKSLQLDRDRYAILTLEIALSTPLAVVYHRGICINGNFQPSPYFDEIEVQAGNPSRRHLPQFLNLIDIIEAALPQTYSNQGLDRLQDPADFVQAMTATLTDKVGDMLGQPDQGADRFRGRFQGTVRAAGDTPSSRA